ncbi:MAG: DUF255 domain-containing protein [Thermoproteales archaeon]|nr:DUF255 domain-containing protein [Thermoproteales archaeon]
MGLPTRALAMRASRVVAWAALALALSSQGLLAQVHWISYEEALAQAKEEGRPVYIYFYSERCPYCKLMEATFSDEEVANLLNSEFIPVRVDVDKRPDLASLYMVPGTPAHLFLYPNGSIIGGVVGYRSPEEFLRILERVRELSRASQREVGAGGSGEAISLAAAFAAGLLAPLSPCILPLLPVVYLLALRGSKRGILAFAAGFTAVYASLATLLGGLLLALRSAAVPIAYSLLLVSGALLLVDRLRELVSSLLYAVVSRVGKWASPRSSGGGLLLGGLSVFLWGPCIAPLAGAALAAALLTGDLARAAAASLSFSAGFIASFTILSLAARRVKRLARRRLRQLERALGAVMMAVALLYFAGLPP